MSTMFEQRIKLKKIALEISIHFQGWTLMTCGYYEDCYLVPDDVAVSDHPKNSRRPYIHLVLNREDRICISGGWPCSRRDGAKYTSPRDVREESPSITCSSARPVEKIAADIQRRFIPEYLRIYKLLQEHLDKLEAGEDQQKEVVEEFSCLLGESTYGGNNVHWYSEGCYGNVDVDHGGKTASLRISGDVDLIKDVLVVVQQYRREKLVEKHTAG